jgi:hypothetical protein
MENAQDLSALGKVIAIIICILLMALAVVWDFLGGWLKKGVKSLRNSSARRATQARASVKEPLPSTTQPAVQQAATRPTETRTINR